MTFFGKCVDFSPSVFFVFLISIKVVSDGNHQWTVLFLCNILQQGNADVSPGPPGLDNVKATVSKRNVLSQ